MALVQPQVVGRFPQADNRHPEFYRDHLGRTWHATAGAKGEPESALQPYGWTAPLWPVWAKGLLLPPPELVKVKREIGKPPIVDIMLDKWLALMENRQAEYEEFQHGVVSALSGGINVPSLLDNPPPRIAKEFGPSPFPGMEFVQMIADGDEWANGLTEEVPEWAEALLPNLRKIARAGKRLDAGSMRAFAAEDRRNRIKGFAVKPVRAPDRASDGVPPITANLPIFSKSVLNAMSKAELIAYGAAAGLTLNEAESKKTILAAIAEASAPVVAGT